MTLGVLLQNSEEPVAAWPPVIVLIFATSQAGVVNHRLTGPPEIGCIWRHEISGLALNFPQVAGKALIFAGRQKI